MSRYMRISRTRVDNNELERGKVLHLVQKLRRITLAIQIAPFVYTVIYIITLSVYHLLPEGLLCVVDATTYISPIAICILLKASEILELCKWHKIACCLPLIPLVSTFVDEYIIELTQAEYAVSIITTLLISILLLFAAYNVFLKR